MAWLGNSRSSSSSALERRHWLPSSFCLPIESLLRSLIPDMIPCSLISGLLTHIQNYGCSNPLYLFFYAECWLFWCSVSFVGLYLSELWYFSYGLYANFCISSMNRVSWTVLLIQCTTRISVRTYVPAAVVIFSFLKKLLFTSKLMQMLQMLQLMKKERNLLALKWISVLNNEVFNFKFQILWISKRLWG